MGKIDDERKAYRVYLVTNAHVFEGHKTVWLRFNPEADEPPADYQISLIDDEGQFEWVRHPNPTIDVAVTGIDLGFLKTRGMRVAYFSSDTHAATVSTLRESGVSEGDFAYVLGFPLGLVGQKRMAVIVRSGSIARIRDALHEGMDTFLLDASVFPGNSGGPVVSKPETISIEGTTAENRSMLIGIVLAYVPYRDEAVSRQTGKTRVIFEENSGLAMVHPVDFIDQAIDEHIRRFPSDLPSTNAAAAQPGADTTTPPTGTHDT